MKKTIGLLAALIASTTVMLAPAKADGFWPFWRGDPKVAVAGIVAGGASIGAYELIRPRHHMSRRAGLTRTAAVGFTTVGCMVVAPMLAAAIVDYTDGRELTSREALGLTGDCVIPFLGSLYWNAYYDAHPEQDKPARRRVR